MYQALYRKYRPQSFDDVVGQNVVTTTLRNQLITGRLSHAYLFTGTHGTGKTTCAKILAKAVNCENPVDGNPCNCCASCRGIDKGSVMDVQEIDAASNNGVDNVRSIRDEVVYPPAEVKKRVYIIDEVHMLSTAAFNALLKTIEEPPEYLIFILATTELNKVPATILSRCQRFAFRRPTAEDITGRIQYVAYQEGIDLEPEAAQLLGRLADGAFRDGLSLLDQCASGTRGTLTVEGVYSILGLAGQEQTVSMLEAIAEKNTAKALRLYQELYSGGKDPSVMLDELGTLARDLLVVKTAPDSGIGMISSTCTAKEIYSLAARFTPEELLRMIGLIQTTTGGFKTSVNQRLDGELCLMHLCQPELSLEAADMTARMSRVEENLTERIRNLEEKLKSGVYTVAASPEPEVWQEDDRPPFPEDKDAPPEPEEEPVVKQSAASDEYWPKIQQRALTDADGLVKSILAQMGGRVRGQVLEVWNESVLFGNLCKQHPEVAELLEKKASFVMEKDMHVRYREGDQRDISGGDAFSALISEVQGMNNGSIHLK